MNGEPHLSLFLLDWGLGRASPGDSAPSKEKSDTANARKYMVGLAFRPGEPSEGPTHPLVFWSKGTYQAPRPDRSHLPNGLSLDQFTPCRDLVNENLYVTRFGAGAINQTYPHGPGGLETKLLC